MVLAETIYYSRTRSLENSIWHRGSRMKFLGTGADTDAQFTAIETHIRGRTTLALSGARASRGSWRLRVPAARRSAHVLPANGSR